MLQDKAPRPAARLQVEIVDTPDALEALAPAWQRLQGRDMESTVFLTWEWLAPAFRQNPWRWSVLVVRDPVNSAEAICIIPLKYRTHWSRTQQQFQTQLEAGGRLLFSEYTGFLCDPAQEEAGLAAAADKLAAMPWARLSMRYVAQSRRARLFTDRLAAQGLDVRYRDYRINKGETDNLVSPQIDLPEEFGGYLKTQLSANTRQRYSKTRRRHLDTGDYTFTHADAATLEEDIIALLAFWKVKWAETKGEAAAEQVAANYRNVLTAAHRCGALFLPVLKRGERRLGALGHAIDRRNGIVHFIVAGRDTQAEETFIGDALHFHSIEWAIAQGFICYDFGHGDERYKYSYGAENLQTLYFDIRRTEPGSAGMLDVLCLGEALKRTEAFIRDGKTDRAARACAQLSGLLT
ncbi:hypothetical protein A3731_18495 [Roseovarius sp. HI0049]|nr:hypothetical protein A3731_18495 [Roseovarius sp. HI0049]